VSPTDPPAFPPAPWHSTVEGVLWLHRATPAAGLTSAPAGRAGLPVTICGLISYRDGPVGPYREIFGAPMMLRGGRLLSHVAFMAVDSAASVAAGARTGRCPRSSRGSTLIPAGPASSLQAARAGGCGSRRGRARAGSR